MKFFLLGSLCLWAFASWGQVTDLYLLVGTYTAKTSEGVYVYRFNTRTGEATPVSITKNIKNPSFLAIAPNQHFVYSVGENDGGAVNAFRFDSKTGALTLLNTQSSGGAGPCHVAVDQTGKWVLVGNYMGGSLSVLPIMADGSLGKPLQTIQHEGKSINPERQEKPHVHSINIAANNQDVFVPDLGTDKIMTYQLDAQTGRLSPGNPPFTATTPGAGPRHFTFHPNGKFAYVIQELDATITGFRYQAGQLSPFQTIKTLPDNYQGRKWCADIHISPDGKFLYGSNRSHESLVIYQINPRTGQLTLVGHQDVLGKTPRNFIIDPTGKWVLVANQDSDNVVIFSRDAKTGKLTPTGKEINVSMPVCLKMMPVE
ncbi:MAG: lactonase family protein [Spirosomataceae bacterium]